MEPNRPASPVRMVKAGLLESQFPLVQTPTHRSIALAVTPNSHQWDEVGEPLLGEGPAMNGLKEMNGTPKRAERLTSANAGSPTSREAQGDGVAIVLNGSG